MRAVAGGGRVQVLGVPVDPVTLDEAAALVGAWMEEGVPPGGTRLVVTPNPEIIWAARRDPELLHILRAADLALADGIGVVWASRRLGRPLPERVTGVDLLQRLLALAAARGRRVFFLGARPGVAERAAAAARSAHPGLAVAGWHHGYFPAAAEAAVAALVRRARPDLLVTGMGFPRDQKWVYRWREELGAPVALGVGGGLDVLAGVARRAPAWVRRLHGEWLFRLLREPRRWRRMLVLPRFALAVLRARAAAG